MIKIRNDFGEWQEVLIIDKDKRRGKNFVQIRRMPDHHVSTVQINELTADGGLAEIMTEADKFTR